MQAKFNFNQYFRYLWNKNPLINPESFLSIVGQYTAVSQFFGSVFCSLYVLTYQYLTIVSKPKSLNELYLACHVFSQSLLKPISLDIKRQHLKITIKSIYTESDNFSMKFLWFPNRPNAKARKNALRNTHKHSSSSPVQIAKRNR